MSHIMESSELWISVLLIIASVVPCNSSNSGCDDFAKNIAKYSTTDSITLNSREIDGVWTSSSCETYNGPKFVLRKYLIGQNGRWYAEHRHFRDGWCSQPTFTLTIKGSYKIGARNAIGGHNGEFNARSFLLVPHDEQELLSLAKVVQQHCQKAGLSEIRQDKDGKATEPIKMNYTLTRDIYRQSRCRERLGIHIYTLKRLRLLRDRKTSSVNDKLYFGATPTHPRRRNYVPNAYHYPLSRATSNCNVCRKLGSAKPGQSMKLHKKAWSKGIAEEWTSMSCQVMDKTFMSRYLKLSSADKKGKGHWRLVYYFFLDSVCKVLSYKIAAEGTYTKPVKSRKIPGAYEVAFNLTNTEITPYEMLIVGSLRAEPERTCGVSANWRAGEMQSVKSTKGCRLFGIRIPSLEYDILKTVRNDNGGIELYTGQSSTENEAHDSPSKRPTSFQLPLRRCRDMTHGLKSISRTEAMRTRKILIHQPLFTLPNNFLLTERKVRNYEKNPQDKNDVERDARYANWRNSASQNVGCIRWLIALLFVQLYQHIS